MRAVFALACLGLVACAADAEPSDPLLASVTPTVSADPSEAHAAPALPSSDVRPIGLGVDVPAPHDQPGGFVCRTGAFCEDFEEQGFATRWGESFTSGTGTIEQTTASASLGRGSLRLFTADESSSAYLREKKGTVAGHWSGVLGFAFRVAAVPSRYLGGPELTLDTADGPVTIRLAMTPEGVFVEQQSTAACASKRCTPKSTFLAAAHPNHWYRITLGFEVNPADVAPYGRLEAAVDDSGDVVSTDLSVPFYDGVMALSAGITQGDVGHRSLADLDDVTLLVR
jgi:hypothetical protein